MKVISSQLATEDDGYEEKEVMVKRGGFWERLWETDPTLHLWDDYKPVIVNVPKKKPAMYRLHDMIVAHPDIIRKITESLLDLSNASTFATASISNLSENYRNYIK